MAFLLQEIRKVINIVVTVCHILRLKCTKIQFRLGLCPRPRWWGACSAPPDPLAGFKGAYTSNFEGRRVSWSPKNP